MSIVVVDQGAELFWFVSSALLQDEMHLKHVTTIPMSEDLILNELPKLVVINGDDKTLLPDKFILKMRNHVFARQTMFIVVTSDTSIEYKKALLTAGAGQVIYRTNNQNPNPKFFRSIVKWFLEPKNPDAQIFDIQASDFPEAVDFTTFGRLGWINAQKCLLEVNVDLQPGQVIDFQSPIFDEIGIKGAKVSCGEKNKIGRFYQYANSMECSFVFTDLVKDTRKLEAWIANNLDISKPKLIKLVFFESDPEEREKIKKMVKVEKRYCGRGFSNIDNFVEDINFQLPHLILVNRKLIQESKNKFEPLKKFLKTNLCYCVTYDNENLTKIEEFKNNYDYALHSPTAIDGKLLNLMVSKLEAKLFPATQVKETGKIYLNKHSPYSHITLRSPCQIKKLSVMGISIETPFALSPFCGFEVSSTAFSLIKLPRVQSLRNFLGKKSTSGYLHQGIFLGQPQADNEIIKEVAKRIAEIGYEKWKNPTPTR